MELNYNRIYGEFLGYPKCCVQAFGDIPFPFVRRSEIVKSQASNGFVPCEECAKKLMDNLISYDELINTNRKCSISFAHMQTEEDQTYLELQKKFR